LVEVRQLGIYMCVQSGGPVSVTGFGGGVVVEFLAGVWYFPIENVQLAINKLVQNWTLV